ncbi:hypothetical protein BP6252_02511 [Coleophoma cylindrospora]|uniref:Swiss Army Knife RNA repair protein HAD domain-containing protein n=1 Tax=Coleophoma cylindrospora TaxID=1849047 RepID=A0A3D8SFF0_9HELO|nr:hypothetical protein BP6252_02511 [Coleophoma cylindrospora]
MSAYHAYHNGASSSKHTLTALSRWSIANKKLPESDKIKSIHVYDFDNTIFNSPLPNPKLWNGPSVGLLQTQDTFATGGWWHDPRILGATGEGVEIEETRGWAGWWNERIIELVQLSMQQKDVLTVLLTGRGETNFSELIKKMVTSKGMDFDLIALKPAVGPNKEKFSSTMNFKQAFLTAMMETYNTAEDIRVYEDRPRHVKGFRDFFMDYNKRQNGVGGSPTRGPIVAEVIQVAQGETQLDPVSETAAVQRIINDHNEALRNGTVAKRGPPFMIKKTVFYTGYLINNTDTQRLLTLAQIPPSMPDTEMKFLANNVLITPRPCPASILEKVGGMGSKTTWEVTGTAVFENKIWAACVRPIPATKKYYTENPVPIVVLALRKGARPIDAGKIQNWQPVPPEKAFAFETTVGEKVLLRIEEEDPAEGHYESLFPNKQLKRKHAQEDDSVETRQPNQPHNRGSQNNGRGGFQQNQQQNHNHGGGRGGHGRGGRGNGNGGGKGGRGNHRGNGGRGKGRGGGHGYRSLDDVGGPPVPAYNAEVTYEDFPPLQKQYQTPQQLVQAQFDQYQQFQQQFQGKGNGGRPSGGGGNGNGELQYF